MSRLFSNIMLVLLLLVSAQAFSQSKEELEKRKKQLEKDIQYTQSLMMEAAKNKESSIEQLNLLTTKISIRQELIDNIVAQVKLLNKQISETGRIVQRLEDDLKKLKEEYAKMIYYAYKNKGYYDRLMFLFSAEDFNQAYKRLKYMQQYTKYRQKQAELIQQTQKVLSAQIEDYEKQKKKKSALLTKSEEEKLQITTELDQKNKLVESLQNKEKELLKELKKKQRDAEKVKEAIAEAIKKEIEKARREAEAAAAAAKAKEKEKGTTTETKVEVRASGFSLTPAEAAISGNFESNKGRLIWPVERGSITGRFGPQKHPVLAGVTTNNTGIDISTDKAMSARAVFDGSVSAIFSVPGGNKAVMVRHGEFISVYVNLAHVNVKMNDDIKFKDEIGTVATDQTTGQTSLHFELWKGKILLNPTDWILKSK